MLPDHVLRPAPADVTVFPERDQVHVRALDQTGTLHQTDRFAGED